MKKTITKLSQPKMLLVIFALSIAVLSGCKKEMDLVSIPDPASQVSFLSQYNVLVFKNMSDLQKMITENAATAGNTVTALNAQFPNFTSMKNIYTQFDKKEAELLANLPDSVLASTSINWANFLKMSDIGRNYSNMILVKQFGTAQDYYYEMNIREKFYADFVNPEGLIVVNDTIYQMSENRVKLITDGDYAKIRMLSIIDSTSLPDHIVVISSAKFIPGYYQPAGTTGCNLTWDKYREIAAGSGMNERRIGMTAHFEQHPEYPSLTKTSFYTALTYSKKRIVTIPSGIPIHIWVDESPLACSLQGAFSGPRSPKDILPGVSGYSAAISGPKNPFTGVTCSLYSPFYHYMDYSFSNESCYAMHQGTYQMTVMYPGLAATIAVSW